MKLHRNYLSALAAALLAGVPLAACTQYGGLPLISSPESSGDNESAAGSTKALSAGSNSTSAADGRGGEASDGPKQAKYTADLMPVQTKGPVTSAKGTATFSIADGNITATVNATGLAPNLMAYQHVHTRSRCPPKAADLNNDGYIDAVEEGVFSGEILIPLDADISKQMDTTPAPGPTAPPEATPEATPEGTPGGYAVAGRYPYPSPTPGMMPAPGDFPSSDASGTLTYTATADLRKMLDDLRSPDPNRRDHIAKLGRFEPLMLGRRSIVIHGVPPDTQLPRTVRSIDGLPAYMTLPVACGEIKMEPGSEASPAPSPGMTPEPSATPSETPGASPTPGETPFSF